MIAKKYLNAAVFTLFLIAVSYGGTATNQKHHPPNHSDNNLRIFINDRELRSEGKDREPLEALNINNRIYVPIEVLEQTDWQIETDWRKRAVMIDTRFRERRDRSDGYGSRPVHLKNLLLNLSPQHYFTEKPEELSFENRSYSSGLIGKSDKDFSESKFSLNDHFNTLECYIWGKDRNTGEVKFFIDNVVIRTVKVNSTTPIERVKLDLSGVAKLTIRTTGFVVIADPILYWERFPQTPGTVRLDDLRRTRDKKPLFDYITLIDDDCYFTIDPTELIYKSDRFKFGLVSDTWLIFKRNIFDLDLRFKVLECTVYATSEIFSSANVNFYGDNTRVLQKLKVDKKNPMQKLKIDVGNVRRLTIETNGSVILAEPYLY